MNSTVAEPSMKRYSSLVEDYTRRQLSDDSDIHNAFAGILDAIPAEFHWGMPLNNYLGYFLGWSADRNEPLPRRELNHCPSWSWMAWKGRISIASAPGILNYYSRWDGRKLALISSPRFDPSARRCDWYSPDDHSPCTMSDIPDGILLTENHLVFRSFVVSRDSRDYALIRALQHNLELLQLSWDESGIAKRTKRVAWTLDTFLKYDPQSRVIILG
jgi:hypothetical protein